MIISPDGYIEGEEKKPVIISSDGHKDVNSLQINKKSGNGILVINTKEESYLK